MGDRNTLLRRNCIDLSHRLIKHQKANGQAEKYAAPIQLQIAEHFWAWVSEGIEDHDDRAKRMDALSQSVVGDPKQGFEAAIAHAEQLMTFMEG